MKMKLKTIHRIEMRTSDPAHLIINVYDSIIQDLDRALKDISRHKFRKANNDIISAQSALSKLLFALSMAEGNEFYVNLSKIYMYLKKLLPTATSYDDTAKIQCVIDHIIRLRETWNGTLHQ